MFKNLFIIGIVIFNGLIYYKLSLSKNNLLKNYASFMKILLLFLSFILAFIKEDYIFIGSFAFGGRASVMMLIFIEILDTVIDIKKLNTN